MQVDSTSKFVPYVEDSGTIKGQIKKGTDFAIETGIEGGSIVKPQGQRRKQQISSSIPKGAGKVTVVSQPEQVAMQARTALKRSNKKTNRKRIGSKRKRRGTTTGRKGTLKKKAVKQSGRGRRRRIAKRTKVDILD